MDAGFDVHELNVFNKFRILVARCAKKTKMVDIALLRSFVHSMKMRVEMLQTASESTKISFDREAIEMDC